MNEPAKWQTMTLEEDIKPSLSTTPISIGSSIWVSSSRSGTGELIELNADSGTTCTISNFPYPTLFIGNKGIGSLIHVKYKDDSIVVLDTRTSRGGVGIVFDTKTRKYSDIFSFQRELGPYSKSNCVAIGDYIHIFHGDDHSDYYIIYSSRDNSSRTFKCDPSLPTEQHLQFAVTKTGDSIDSYRSSTKTFLSGFTRMQSTGHIPAVIVDLISEFCRFELFKFGRMELGRDRTNCVDSFHIGTLKNGNPLEPIQWKLAPEYNLKRPLRDFGYIQHGPFIVTFGGFEQGANDLSDDILILDLRKDCGWIQSPVKCPRKAKYHAVLDNQQRIYLYGRNRFGHLMHHIMNLSAIINWK